MNSEISDMVLSHWISNNNSMPVYSFPASRIIFRSGTELFDVDITLDNYGSNGIPYDVVKNGMRKIEVTMREFPLNILPHVFDVLGEKYKPYTLVLQKKEGRQVSVISPDDIKRYADDSFYLNTEEVNLTNEKDSRLSFLRFRTEGRMDEVLYV